MQEKLNSLSSVDFIQSIWVRVGEENLQCYAQLPKIVWQEKVHRSFVFSFVKRVAASWDEDSTRSSQFPHFSVPTTHSPTIYDGLPFSNWPRVFHSLINY